MTENNDKQSVTVAVAKVVTMADNGLRFVFDAPETAIEAAAWLMIAKREGLAVRLQMTAE